MKTELTLMDTVICRTPAFSPSDQLDERWDELKRMIREASEEFYNLVEKIDHDQLAHTNEKIRFSVWKYFNRSRFRSTPFGSFAGISYIPLTANSEPLTLEDTFIRHEFTDWSHKDTRNGKVPQWFLTNAIYYIVGHEIRYVRFTGDVFELAATSCLTEITTLLRLCHEQTKREYIRNVMLQQFSMIHKHTDELIGQLLDIQLLFSEQSANITGPDHFERLMLKAEQPKYIIAERKYVSGGFDPSPLRILPEYFNFIKGFLPQATNSDLNSFRRNFIKRFDLRAVPLALALDPETGVGYGSLATEPEEEVMSAIFGKSKPENNENFSFSHSPQHNFLLKKLINGGVINLADYKGEINTNTPDLPNTISAIITCYRGRVILDTVGGCTANALIGRFTLAGGEALQLAKNIASIEENANPHILFFDVAYQAEKRVDNVNRRQQLYENELPLLSWSCVKEPLLLDDLLVMVRQDEIILWSKKHNKRVVPRIASAYNYNRSDLAIYRFLCDLQHQQLCTDLTFRFRQFIPGLDHYPRVVYKDLIVYAAMWKFNITPADITQLKKWLDEKHIDTLFKCGNSDQTLCFDPENEDDLRAFLTYTRQNNTGDIYITEALLGDTVSGRNGAQYVPQYIAGFFHREPVYAVHQQPALSTPGQVFHPGDEWLYLEVYCRPKRSNMVLQYIRRFIYKNRQQLKKWFFIRYSDPSPHIRLRLLLKDALNIGVLLSELNKALFDLIDTGLIADMQVKTYNRELERYGPERMEMVESFFYKDSQYITQLLSRKLTITDLRLLTLQLMSRWLQLAGLKDTRLFIQAVADGFSKEFKLDQQAFKQLNKSFETIKNELGKTTLVLNATYEAAYFNVINDCRQEAEKERMLADLIHMHVNRLFFTNQRKHEALLYQYLQKWFKIMQFREAAVQAH
jgi:thiopeptide-type bacteriocin biosynthesis protein